MIFNGGGCVFCSHPPPFLKKLQMKKSLALFCVMAFCTISFFTGCKEKIKNVRGQVVTIEHHGDTLLNMKVRTSDETLLFKLDDARFNIGVMLEGDSVLVNYVKGHGDSLRALIVTVLPRPARYLENEIDSSKEVLTVPEDSVNKTLEY